MTADEIRALLNQLHALLDRAGQLILEARKKHEAEVERRAAEPSAVKADMQKILEDLRKKYDRVDDPRIVRRAPWDPTPQIRWMGRL